MRTLWPLWSDFHWFARKLQNIISPQLAKKPWTQTTRIYDQVDSVTWNVIVAIRRETEPPGWLTGVFEEQEW